ncbi:hypothetical protein ACE6H2_001045 [Prunus campanulata]
MHSCNDQVSSLLPIKLTRDNYLVWKELFFPILQTSDLLGLINGTDSCPTQYIPNPDNPLNTTVNPDFLY